MPMMLGCVSLVCNRISRATWCLSICVSLCRLYSLRATVMPLRRSTAWYTMLMLPLYIRFRTSKSCTFLRKMGHHGNIASLCK
jgi:hypothetical protein